MSDDSLYPANFEVYPEITSVYPQMGALTGGTLITIKGSGFIDDGLKRGNSGVSVTVGDKVRHFRSNGQRILPVSNIVLICTILDLIQFT